MHPTVSRADEDDGRHSCYKGGDAYNHHAQEAGHEEASEVAEDADQRSARLALFALRTELLVGQEMPE